jgi:hypothetical protein
MQPLVREPSAHACLMNALAVSEFLATFGVLCEASRLNLAELQLAASSLDHASVLAQLYTSLLRCVLLEKVRGWSAHDLLQYSEIQQQTFICH